MAGIAISEFRAPTWAPMAQMRAEVDALQRRCAAMAIYVARFPLEEAGAYRRRRGRIAAAALAETKTWSARVVDAARQRMLALRDEAAGARTWLGAVFRMWGARWLEERRVAAGSESVHAGRIRARVAPGRASPRFEEGTAAACRELGIHVGP